MNRMIGAALALVALGACGDGNPFTDTENPSDGDETAGFVIPEEVAGSLTGFTYDPDAETLSLSGLLRDGDTQSVTYRRRAGLDQGVYAAFTAQDDPLDEHTTVYVRNLGAVEAAVAVTGGQFTYYSGGTNFSRTGSFDPITPSAQNDTGLATYAGEYIGLSNLNGPDTDLEPAPPVDPDAFGSSVQPSQASVVNGRILINVQFGQNQIAGEVYDRVITSDAFGQTALPDLILVPSDVGTDGNFVGELELPGNRQDVGGYAGTIGGTDAETLAGGLFAEEHFGDSLAVSGEEEFGVFVLGRCGGALADVSTECSAVED